MPRDVRHIPVLLEHVLNCLKPAAGQTIVDCTVGLGGHSAELLRRVGLAGRLIGMDIDAANIQIARERLAHIAGRFELFQSNFAGLPTVLAQAGAEQADGILADLGVASPQIDDPARGFSYRHAGPLDMRMDPTRGKPASAMVNEMSEVDLEAALRELGDEEDAAEIARLIVERRAESPIVTTECLTAIVCEARHFTLTRAAGAKLHPAARTFQALRMLVNREIANLQRLLVVLPQCLKPGGRAAIISFHSGEDRLVKRAFREGLEMGVYSEVAPDPLIADDAEIRVNPRSRSAKLRFAVKSAVSSP